VSHFTVMVVTDEQPTKEILHRILLPWHEYECTGYEDFVEFVPAEESLEEMQKNYAENGRESTFEAFVGDYYGYHKNEEGVLGRKTNPNARWDWWTVGGRWSNSLMNKEGVSGDSFRFGDVDFDGIRRKRVENANRDYDEAFKKYPEDATARYFNFGIEAGETKEKYVARFDVAFSAFGVVLDGEWIERGKMGWWACVSDEKSTDDWSKTCEVVMSKIRPDQWVTIVDCHI